MQSPMENRVADSRRAVQQAVAVRDFAVSAVLIGLAILFAILAAAGMLPVRHPGHVFTACLLVAVLAAAWLVFQHVGMPRSRAGIVDVTEMDRDIKHHHDQS